MTAAPSSSIPAPPQGTDEFWLLNHLEAHGLHSSPRDLRDLQTDLEIALERFDMRAWVEVLVQDMRAQYHTSGQSPCGCMLWARRNDAQEFEYGAHAWPTWLALAATDPLSFVTVQAMGREYELAVALIWYQHEPGSLAALVMIANPQGEAGVWLAPRRGEWESLNCGEALFAFLRETLMVSPEEELTRNALGVPDFREGPIEIAPDTRDQLDVFDLLDVANSAYGSAVASSARLARELADRSREEALAKCYSDTLVSASPQRTERSDQDAPITLRDAICRRDRGGMAAWLAYRFSDNVRAQQTIAAVAEGILAIGVVLMIAVFFLAR